jgi:hypothetical protein
MSKASTRRTRKLRRTKKQVMRYGSKAKSKHKLVAGRTGGVHIRKLRSRNASKSHGGSGAARGSESVGTTNAPGEIGRLFDTPQVEILPASAFTGSTP